MRVRQNTLRAARLFSSCTLSAIPPGIGGTCATFAVAATTVVIQTLSLPAIEAGISCQKLTRSDSFLQLPLLIFDTGSRWPAVFPLLQPRLQVLWVVQRQAGSLDSERLPTTSSISSASQREGIQYTHPLRVGSASQSDFLGLFSQPGG